MGGSVGAAVAGEPDAGLGGVVVGAGCGVDAGVGAGVVVVRAGADFDEWPGKLLATARERPPADTTAPAVSQRVVRASRSRPASRCNSLRTMPSMGVGVEAAS